MNSKDRLLTVLNGQIPDCVPVAPDFSNMIPARRTGKPFWEVYLHNDPPIWEAYIDCAKYFDIDAVMDGYFPLTFPGEVRDEGWERFIVFKSDQRLVTQGSRIENGQRVWQPFVDVYYVADSPTMGVPPSKIGLPPVPEDWEPLDTVRPVKPVEVGPAGLRRVKALMGDQGVVGVWAASTAALDNEQAIYNYYDHPDQHERWAQERVEAAERRFAQIMSMDVRPDFICVGGSGSLIFQTVKIFRQLAFPAVKRVIELATNAGLPTHVHSCGPEKALIKIFAEETSLTVIDPLEIPPMGDCNLAEIKRLYGNRIVLKGNLHTTDVMLRGTVDTVVDASKQAINDGAAGGRFILSTGDQCGRDTPDENLFAMIDMARTYGRY